MAGSNSRKRGGVRKQAVEPQALARVRRLIGDAPYRRDLLIEYLHRLQDALHGLPAAELAALAGLLHIGRAEVYEVASFYHHFDIVHADESMPPAVTLRVCDSISCQLAGAEALIERLQQTLDSEVRLQRVPCVGRCDSAPVAVLGQYPIGNADSPRIAAAIAANQVAAEMPDAIDHAAYLQAGGYRLLADCRSGRLTTEQVLERLDTAGLRGLGGAGFPLAQKWRIVRQQPEPRLMAVNIDEGEPGTFKDRHYLEQNPHQFLEGMLIAATVVGIDRIYIYLRDEYAGCRALLQRELQALRESNPDTLPTIELRRGAGAYICGEESALIESLEGRRGEPRLRPPYVAERGLFGRPTLVQNMESLHWVPEILRRGADWFAAQGRAGHKGLRSFSVSGRVARPGVHLAPAGITLQQLIDDHCGGMAEGHRLYGWLPGGASGGILPAALADLPLDFGTLETHGCFIGSAAVIVLSQQDSASSVALNAMRFFAHESCGQCTPCRVGTARAADLMAEDHWDQPRLRELAEVMQEASICGLGQAAANPLLCLLEHFPVEVTDEQ